MDWKIELVVAPVGDVARAKEFYTGIGFAADFDKGEGEDRMVQVTPPGSGCSVLLSRRVQHGAPGSLSAQLVVDDVEAARAHLVEHGAQASPVQHFTGEGALVEGHGEPWNSFVFFADPDGNRWSVQQRP
ncbi:MULTISPECIES: VOC family protein [Nocardiopsis]|uniref:Catechol 2,3-dioxygenase-like lactoylglutathione lyase family enzyme n=1 Tax=Nocardiopsis sinuspersici TaxID=501010 RepID=A0A1V3BZI7_9ACTN|nr:MULTISPECIES: VOC family protein [Nocardiopsis]NYH55163.1 catechol 2,3-dioxygenase-like lactoylglutathione lyase family enzyme [Nocardiopsis sinuspersici]OOC53865.1 hypothetical protein NOSIN_08650 [Nocardiopsis sinuspersici]